MMLQMLLLLLLLASTAAAARAAERPAVVHIELAGSDATGDGSAGRPFRTLVGWNRVRHTASSIAFGPGVHSLVDAGGLALTSPGTAGAPVVVSGAGPGQTLLSGGVRVLFHQQQPVQTHGSHVSSSAAAQQRRWTATLPANTTYFRQLFVRSAHGGNFSRRLTARSEEMVYERSSATDPEHTIYYKSGQVLPSYHNQEDVLATLYHCWTATTHHIDAIGASNRSLTLRLRPHGNIPRCESHSGKRYYIENAREELDRPGEFYYDRHSRELTYLPLPHEQLGDAAGGGFEAWAPQLVTPVALKASNLILRDLSVVHAAADMSAFFDPLNDCDGQSASSLQTGAVAINCSATWREPSVERDSGGASNESKCSNVTLHNVEIAHAGGWGVITHEAVHNVALRRLKIHDLGAGGVNIKRPAAWNWTHQHEPPSRAGATAVTIEDSEIYNGGHIYKMGSGVLMQQCHCCAVSHNRIHHFLNTGISTGMGFADGRIGDVRLEYNEIYTLGQGVLNDMGQSGSH